MYINLFKIILICISYYIICIDQLSKNIYVVISSCPKDNKLKINISAIPYKAIILFCNKTTNKVDSNEAGLMLDFIIKTYNKYSKKKYIFIHDHVISWHHPVSIYKRIEYLRKKSYFDKVDFGGIYCKYMVFGEKTKFDFLFNETYTIDIYMRKNNYINISLYQLYKYKYIFPCCSTFIVENSRIVNHPQSFYVNLRKGLKQYVLSGGSNQRSSNYMEYMWSIIFGIQNIPHPPDCDNDYVLGFVRNKNMIILQDKSDTIY